MLTEIYYLLISGSYPKDRSLTGCTADYVLTALPSPMELAKQQREKEGEI